MAARLNGDALCWLDTLNREGSFAEKSDSQLLVQFLLRWCGERGGVRGPGSRHGPTILSLCRVVLLDDHSAADAFQATFLVLARRASTIRDRDNLGPWLRRVARRIAVRYREELVRSAAFEQEIAIEEFRGNPTAVDCVERESASLVRAEVARLPGVERLLLQLIYWQGKSYEEAAAHLSWPIGTVRSRLSRIRERLRGRLTRLGLAPFCFSPAQSHWSSQRVRGNYRKAWSRRRFTRRPDMRVGQQRPPDPAWSRRR